MPLMFCTLPSPRSLFHPALRVPPLPRSLTDERVERPTCLLVRGRADGRRALRGHWLLDVTVPLASSPPCPLEKLSPCFGLKLCMTSRLCRPAPVGLAGSWSPWRKMEGCEPDPSEGPGTFPRARCHAALLRCVPSWRGTGSPRRSADGLVERSSSLARAFGSSLFLGDAGCVSDTGGNSQTFPSSTSSPRGACRGTAWQPVRAPLQAL